MTQPYASKKESKKSSKSPITSLRTANNIPEFQVQTAKTTIPRKTYKTYWDFIISSIGSTVGLGNIWRFPRLTYDHGGSTKILISLRVNCTVYYIVSFSVVHNSIHFMFIFCWIALRLHGNVFGSIKRAWYR